ncbi:MAG: nucleoside triphosphate pyrophosphohydrolase [Rhodobacter sp.]|nr:nucleoside triphosphate pyrophosphohydrolase [Rhodobacter sp.]
MCSHRDAPEFSTQGGLSRLLEIMRRLRDPESGCPWDIEQTFASIAPHTIEEAYEVADAIDRQAWEELKDELGDLLLQTVYHAVIGEEEGRFDLDRIADRASAKMVSRHPHIFGDGPGVRDADQQIREWESAKAAERATKGSRGALDGVTIGMPALLRALKLQKRAARVGFDWPDTISVTAKIGEEAQELTEARTSHDPAKVFEELGDLLFSVVNLARHLDIDPEAALRSANGKFTRRFQAMEARLAELGREIQDSDPAEMDTLWNEVKASDAAND